MNIQLFNGWYFLFLFISIGTFIGLYFLLKNKKQKTIKIVLFSLLAFALVLHFLKLLFPPYSTNQSYLLRDSWFINICAAHIALFPFFFLSKNNHIKDYMVYLGLISGILSILYPVEPIQKANQSAEWLDVIRFYIHHNILWQVPLLMVLTKIHTLNYKRVWSVPILFMCVLLFIMINQVLQSELGFVSLRGNDIFNIGYKNTSFIWGPGDDDIAKLFTWLCPSFFKTIPVGEFAGQTKYWPWFWLIVPAFVYFIILSFLIALIFDFKSFKTDIINIKNKIKTSINNRKERKNQKHLNMIAKNNEDKEKNNESN